MINLTEEQKRRIEINKQKALERLALKNKQPSVNNNFNSTINNKIQINNLKSNTTSVSKFYKTNKPTSLNATTSNATNKSTINSNKNFQQCADSTKPAIFGMKKPSINGVCRLISQNRFTIDIGYHAQLVDIFKSIPSCKYDAKTRKWDFNLCDYDKILLAVKPLQCSVTITQIPMFIRKTITDTAKYPPLSSIDLMSVDALLLEAFMPFQREAVSFGVSRNGRVLLADDMGLGKTIQALGIASYYRCEWPLLIVTPSSVRYVWVEAINRWVSSVSDYEIVVLNSGKDTFDGAQVIILSYDLLSRRAKELLDAKFNIVIMDESHMLKDFKRARFKSASPIMKSASRLILLSGTPALSRPSELFTQISSINSSMFPIFQEFGIRYCDGKKQPWGWDFNGASNMEELNIILQSTIMIRRLKADVISQLPSKQRMTVFLNPSSIEGRKKELEAAAQLFSQKKLRGAEKHGALLQFFVQTAHAKAQAVSEYVKELLESDKKVVIYAHHKVMMEKLCETCEAAKTRYIRIDGTTASNERQQCVDEFQSSCDVRAAVLSITAANAGITLTAAHLVVFAELYWNPGILVQAEDRAHRIGQKDSVLVQYLVAKGTADDHIWPLVQSKLDILNKAGLSKDNFTDSKSAQQKIKGQESITDYFPVQNDEDLSFISEFDEEPSSKKFKID